jgi:transglutaminase-like putative cysteine protease
MRLKVGCQLEYQTYEETHVILLLRPHKSHLDSVVQEEFIVEPKMDKTEYIDFYSNHCDRMIVPIGHFRVNTSFIVDVSEFSFFDENVDSTPIQNLPDAVLIYLLPSRFCESDKLNNLASEIVSYSVKGFHKVEAIRRWVNDNVRYEYNHSNSSTSALDTLNSRIGVCRDMSHLAISLCRSIGIPARIVVGYLYLLYPMDMHAWFEAYLDGKWYTFDASQQVTTGGRVALAHGRDATDVATATFYGEMELQNMYVSVEKIGL